MRDAPRSTRRSAACAVGDHLVCPHLMGFKLACEQLCCCTCHDACRYAGAVSVTPHEWWDSCRCPGSEWMREEGRRWWGRGRLPTLDEALQSARADEAWYEVPLQPPLAPDASAFTAFKALLRTARQPRTQHRKFAAAVSGATRRLEGPRGQPPYLVEKAYSLPLADVVLDSGAVATLNQFREDGIVSLERDPEARVAVYSGQQRLGTLSQEDGFRYRPALDAAQQGGRSLMVWSELSGLSDGAPQLRVYPAGIL